MPQHWDHRRLVRDWISLISLIYKPKFIIMNAMHNVSSNVRLFPVCKICLVVLPKKNERKHSVNRKSCTQFAFEIRESVFEWQIFFSISHGLWSCCIENQSLVNSNCERVRDDKQSWEEQALREKERKEKISTIKTSEREAAPLKRSECQPKEDFRRATALFGHTLDSPLARENNHDTDPQH